MLSAETIVNYRLTKRREKGSLLEPNKVPRANPAREAEMATEPVLLVRVEKKTLEVMFYDVEGIVEEWWGGVDFGCKSPRVVLYFRGIPLGLLYADFLMIQKKKWVVRM